MNDPKGVAANRVSTKYQKQCQILQSRLKKKNKSDKLLAATHISHTFQTFCCKIETPEKIKYFFLLGVTLASSTVKSFHKTSKFYCNQDTKTIKLKYVVKDQISLTVTTSFRPLFIVHILIF